MPQTICLNQSPLGKAAEYHNHYNPSLLFPISRREARCQIGIDDALPFYGIDLWTAYEISWLNNRGKPHIALAHFKIPCTSPNLIESKSLKLYLNSLNNTKFESSDKVRSTIEKDLNNAVGTQVDVEIITPERFSSEVIRAFEGTNLDNLDTSCNCYTPSPELLRIETRNKTVQEILVSDLLKSNCPVTGQPDWGSIQISYKGAQINHESLLHYIVSFRDQNEFHEQCIERIFTDILRECRPDELTVFARYTRRGGLDINPWRSNAANAQEPDFSRHARQ